MTSLTDRFDPADVLDIYPFSDQPWAKSLVLGEKQQAVRLFVRALRTGEPRSPREFGIANIIETWMGHTIGMYGGHNLQPDEVIKKHYVGCYGKEHTFEGDIDWLYDATENDGENQTAEWQVQINRHYQWVPLAQRYEATGDAKYARHWEYELRTWVDQCLPRPFNGNLPCPSAWRTIDTGIRAAWTWPYAFETFRKSPHVSDEALWLFVVAMHEMGKHLLYWPKARNWKTMETNGLAHVGMMFPEVRHSHAFRDTAIDRVVAEALRQFYPDGMQDELAPSYAIVSITNLYAPIMLREHFAQRFTGIPITDVPRDTWQRLTNAVTGLATLAAPDGVCAPIHDSPPTDVRSMYRAWKPAGDVPFDATREPWLEPGLHTLPFAGWTTMRRADGRYLLFDTGPWGTAHQHSDAMQVLLFAHDTWFAVDPGKPLYNRSALTSHMRSSAGHNVVLMDGRPHLPAKIEWMIHEPYELLTGQGAGDAAVFAASAKRSCLTRDEPKRSFEHTRTVIDLPALGWLLVDELQPGVDDAHHWEWLWHMPVAVAVEGDAVVAKAGNGASVWMTTVSEQGVVVDRRVLAGQTEPEHRGWHAVGQGDTPTPCPTASITVPSTRGKVWLATLLSVQPAGGSRHATVQQGGRTSSGFELQLGDAAIQSVRVEHAEAGLRVVVTSPDGEQAVTLPRIR